MPKLYSSNHIIKVLQSRGFVFISQKGSHVKLRKFGISVLTVIVPAGRKQVPMGTFKSVLRQSGMSAEDFES
jgi:predicted RNA binding protein YcfA (HicA-like mRNA interferase family)